MAERGTFSIPSPFNGISEQSPHLRLPSQVESAQNMWLDIQTGASKRNGSRIEFSLGAAFDENNSTQLLNGAQMWPILRDSDNQYLLLIGQNPAGSGDTVLKIVQVGVTRAACTCTISAAAQTYLNVGSGTKTNRFKIVSVADTTFIVNTLKGVVAADTNTALTGVATGTIGAAVVVNCVAHGRTTGDWVTISKSNSTPSVDGGYQITVTGVDAFTIVLNATVTVAATTGTVHWSGIDKTSMPIQLVRTGSTTFTLGNIDWTQRKSGNNITNPLPALFTAGGDVKIADAAYWRGRLVLGGDEIIACSGTDDAYNFFAKDSANVVESDAFSRTLSSEVVTLVENLVPIRRSLYIFTKSGRQFDMSTGSGPLSQETVKVNPVTAIPTVPDVKPVVCDPSIFFVGKYADAAHVHEIIYDDIDIPNQSNWLNSHCPTLLTMNEPVLGSSNRSTALSAVASPEHNCVFVLMGAFTEGGNARYGRDIFMYKYFNLGQNRVQSAFMQYVADTLPAYMEVHHGSDWDLFHIWDMAVVSGRLYWLTSMAVPTSGDDVINVADGSAVPYVAPTYAPRTTVFFIESCAIAPSGGLNDNIASVVAVP